MIPSIWKYGAAVSLLLMGFWWMSGVIPITAFLLITNPMPFHRYYKIPPLLLSSSTININENNGGELISDVYSTTSIDGRLLNNNNNNNNNAALLHSSSNYYNKTESHIEEDDDDDDDEHRSVMSSVTHWSDIMRRQDSIIQQQQQRHKHKHRKLQNHSSLSSTTTTTTFSSSTIRNSVTGNNNSNNNNNNNNTDTTVIVPLVSSVVVESVGTLPKPKRLDDISLLSHDELQELQSYWERLMPTVHYLGHVHVTQIYKALQVAYQAHRGQKRKSGDPFIIHPLEVALLLSGLKMDAETIMAGLLHDTVEDTDLTFAQVEEYFGRTVRSIVEGETKVSKLPKQLAISEYADEQAENLRQMFVAMTDDYRIIIVKLADRLHNMRTLNFMKPEKQIKISRETLDIFAPLAHRMGIWQFKSELEDTAFKYLYPDEHKRLSRRLRQHQKKFKDTLSRSQEMLQRRLDSDPTLMQQAAKVEVFGRRKEIYSLWHKMETKKETNLENIIDVVALRVIITPAGVDSSGMIENETDRGVWLCYHVLGLVQHLQGFQPVPTKVKDYISFAKPNGYQSLHTALILDGQSIEVQIRTRMMHQVAEFGMASHWAYTENKRMKNGEGGLDLYKTPWLSSIKEWQNDSISSRDFVDSVRRELLGKRVFVFLRNGKILNLARGASAIDAAFQIHTEIGLTMHGVEINGKPVPFSYELRNGDVVSILTGKGKPATDWMRYAKSRSTRSKLRAYFRARQKESLRESGKILMMDYLWMHGPLIERESYIEDDFKVPTLNVEDLKPFLNKTQYEYLDDLLIVLGREHDRALLHKVVSQMFDVPRKLLVDAEEKKNHRYVTDMNSANPLKLQSTSRNSALGEGDEDDSELRHNDVMHETTRDQIALYTVDTMLSRIAAPTEYADPDHTCKVCFPICGDEIVGTRRSDQDPSSTMPTVHRIGCPHSQQAINRAWAEQRFPEVDHDVESTEGIQADSTLDKNCPKVDSFTLRHRSWTNRGQKQDAYERLVKLEWSDLDDCNNLFLSEVVVVAEDRKQLLADCSQVVSNAVEIVKTGSITTNEHATLVFLVKVTGLDNLQNLMDNLGRIRSVMSVERRFGSELLR